MGTHVTTDNGELLRECDIVILGVKPNMLEEAIRGCSGQNIPSNKHILFVSMLAGVSLSKIKEVGTDSRYREILLFVKAIE